MLINNLEVQPFIKNERNYPHSYKENIIVHRTYPLVFEGKRAPASH